jgi:chromosomal replication initiation ATPase DnaA
MVAPIPVTAPSSLEEARARAAAIRRRIDGAARRHAECVAGRLAEQQRMEEAAEAEHAARVREAKVADRDAMRVAVEAIVPADVLARNPRRIMARIAAEFGVTLADIIRHDRRSATIRARFAAIHAVNEANPHLTLSQLGMHFGGRDHTSILNALRKVEREGVPRPTADKGGAA